MSCEYKEKVLQFLKNDIEDSEIEAHIDQCAECNAMVEGYLEKEKELLPSIPKTEFSDINQGLKLKVIKYNRGRSRIIMFTLIGMLMGWLSFHYMQDSFLVTKVIMAIPYKISEMIYVTLHDIPYIYRSNTSGIQSEFFPQSLLITFMAERLTPVFIGGAIYGSIGYFTGDKRIFTLSKFIKFALLWGAINLLWIGVVFAGNAVCIKENSQLKDITGFFINAEDHGDGFYEDSGKGDYFELLRSALGDVTLLKDRKDYRYTDKQTTVGIYMGFGGFRFNLTTVNWEEKYMIMDMGRVVTIPDEFATLIKEYYERTGHFSYDELDKVGKTYAISEKSSVEKSSVEKSIKESESSNLSGASADVNTTTMEVHTDEPTN